MSARRLGLVVLVLVGAFVLGVGSAFAVVTPVYSGLSFGPAGVGGGSFVGVQGVAVHSGSGDVYLYDSSNEGSVYKFDAAGKPAGFPGLEEEHSVHPDVIEGVGGGGAAENQIGVDNSFGPAAGDIYVANGESGQVRVYSPFGVLLGEVDPSMAFPESGGEPCGVAVDPLGNVYVAHFSGHVDKYSPADDDPAHDVFVGELEGVGSICNIAADSEGSVYTDLWGGGANTAVTKYEASQFGLPVPVSALFPAEGTVAGRTLTIDPSNNDVYVDQGNEVVQYTSTGVLLTSFGGVEPGVLSESAGVAVNGSSVDPETREVYAENGTTGQVELFGPLVTLPQIVTGEAIPVGAGETLTGTVNPNEVPLTSCEFEYNITGQAPIKVACSEIPASGNTPAEVHASLTGAQLTPLGEYHYRLLAKNTQGTSTGQEQAFTAPGAPTIENESVINVSAESGTLQAQINPDHSQTTYHFEYDTNPYTGNAQHGTSIPNPDTQLGSGGTGLTIGAHVQGLTPKTLYHYRVVTTNTLGTARGADQTFTTESLTTGSALPDGRQYELVSPANKYGTEILGIDGINSGGVIQAAYDGSKISYVTAQPPVADPQGNSYGNQVYSVRGADGWQSQSIATPHNARTGVTVGEGSEYRVFSPDLSLGLVEPHDITPLTSDAPTKSHTLYLRNNFQGSYLALITANQAPEKLEFQFVGASSDLSHILSTFDDLSEWSNGQLRRVSILPNGEPTEGQLGAEKGYNTRGAVSDDGSNTIWTVPGSLVSLYDRDLNTGVTLRVDAAQGGPESGDGYFEIAAANASKVFFRDDARLTTDSTASGIEKGSFDLYEFDVKMHKLVDLSTGGETARALGVVGTSEDGGTVYFVARGDLATGATSGAPNLYIEHEGIDGWEAPKFITTLSKSDITDWWGQSALPREETSRVSPNGRFVAFVSTASLTGYDNRDAASDFSDAEVFVYDSFSGRLSCASCDPSGARPSGERDGYGGRNFASMDPTGALEGQWVAGMIPASTPYRLQRAWYQSRVLSDSGRLFFTSSDALASQDINGKDDVYEFEPDGVGDCVVVAGCVSLVSAGTGGADSSFVDASASGDDVFFITRDRLVGEDFDHVFDMYDAHVCTSIAPCFRVPPVLPPPCSTGDGCKPSPSPQPSIFGDPSSATFSGVGNVTVVSTGVKHVLKKRPVKHKTKKKTKPKKGKKRKGKKGKRGGRGVVVSGRAKR